MSDLDSNVPAGDDPPGKPPARPVPQNRRPRVAEFLRDLVGRRGDPYRLKVEDTDFSQTLEDLAYTFNPAGMTAGQVGTIERICASILKECSYAGNDATGWVSREWKAGKSPGHFRDGGKFGGYWTQDWRHHGWQDHKYIFANNDKGRKLYVGEPYQLSVDDLRALMELADAGWRVSVDGASHHFPGSTIRVTVEARDAKSDVNPLDVPGPISVGSIPLPSPEHWSLKESSYRRGYCHGASAALDEIYVKEGDRLSRWHESLMGWRYRGNLQTEEQPPDPERGPAYKPIARIVEAKSIHKGATRMRDATVQFIEDPKTGSLGIVTDAESPESFLGQCAEELHRLIRETSEGTDWGVRLAYWLPQIVEAACKLKGYKADVRERRLIIAGDFSPDAFSKAGEIGPGLSLRLAATANENGKEVPAGS